MLGLKWTFPTEVVVKFAPLVAFCESPRCTSGSPLRDELLAFETESFNYSGASEPENLEESCIKPSQWKCFGS